MTDIHKCIVFDKWLSDILHKNTYKVVNGDFFLEMAKDEKNSLMRTINTDRFFLYAKVSVDSPAYINALEKQGFHLVDTNISFEKKISFPGNMICCCNIKLATPKDEVQTVELANKSFKYSRFHLDSSFSNEVANNIKAEWVRSFFLGKRGDMLIVALINNTVVGFLLLIKEDERTLVVDLIAVDSDFRGSGIAKDMIAFSQIQFKDLNCIRVGTQLANKPSINLYENLFFRFVEANYVFHYHSSSA